MSNDVLPPAFYRAEADYLTPPEHDICVCTCDNCREDDHCQSCDPPEPDWEKDAEERAELREERDSYRD